MNDPLWERIGRHLADELKAEDLHMWIDPLQADFGGDSLTLYAPNAIVCDAVQRRFANIIRKLASDLQNTPIRVSVAIGSREGSESGAAEEPQGAAETPLTGVDPQYRFENFVQGRSNQLGGAAALQVTENPGSPDYNPLLLYGGTGLGKTHLLHAVGNRIHQRNPRAVICYLHAEQFVSQMIQALRHNTIDQFKARYRTVNTLLIDDIQFFANKERSQEEFFHTFNALLEGKQQIILTCDRYPKEVSGLEARLKSRFGWGLTVGIEPPDFETRVAILMSKAADREMELEEPVAFHIAKRIRSNVRELEGALNTLCANARFTGAELTLDFVKETLKDVLTMQDRILTLSFILKTVAEYYKLRLGDLLSRKRSRSIARPRQLAMALAKELTDHSLPEIGEAVGGRDHTTVLHACRKIEELRRIDGRMAEDYDRLLRILTT